MLVRGVCFWVFLGFVEVGCSEANTWRLQRAFRSGSPRTLRSARRVRLLRAKALGRPVLAGQVDGFQVDACTPPQEKVKES